MAEINQKDFLNVNNEEEQKSFFTFKTIWTLFYLNWYWVILSIILCMGVAYLYLRYTKPTYSASMKVLVKESDGKRGGSAQMSLDELGMMSMSDGFDNELEIITSATVVQRVVKNLKLYTTYIGEGRVVDNELYKTSPILVDLEESRLNALKQPIRFEITQQGKGIHVECKFNSEDPKQVTTTRDIDRFPYKMPSKFGTIIFQRNPGYRMGDGKLFVTISNPKDVARNYAARLNAAATTKTTTIAKVDFIDQDKDRCVDFLRELVKCYNDDANEDKNEVARKTEEFIAQRIGIIRGELDETEGHMENYKRQNELINLPNDASVALTGSTDYQKQQVDMQTQISLLKSLMDYMDKPSNYLHIIPANLGLEDQSLVKNIADYNALILKRNRYIKGSSEDNPTVVQVTQEAEDFWPFIRQNMSSIYKDMQRQKQTIDSQFSMFNGKIDETPVQERELNNLTRQQELKSGLYLTLLQKREENFIQLASTAAKARLIDEPQPTGQVAPKARIIWTGAFAIGFFAPLAILFGLSFLRYRIEGRDDVERLCSLPILADIPFAHELDDEGQRAVVVRENRNNMMEESFRGLRTNLKFILKEGEQVIITTSCIPGEGKTFVATNLAMSLALLGKKVLVIGLDIRKPQLVKLFGLTANKRGITNFLMLSEPDYELLDEQITNSNVNSNLDVLPAGIIPPNPAELISSKMLGLAIEHLKTRYDFILLDTPPVGLVSDTLNMGHLANMTIFVARADYSPKANFELINDIVKNQKLPKCNIVLNGMDLERRKYGYYYGYGKYGNYGKYGKYGKYGNYGTYSKYGYYGVYGKYGSSDGKKHTEK